MGNCVFFSTNYLPTDSVGKKNQWKQLKLPGGGIIRGGPNAAGGGTAVIFGGGFENGFCAILPALNAAVVASIKC